MAIFAPDERLPSSATLRNSKSITFSDRHTSRSKLHSTLSYHRIFSYFVNCLFFQLGIRCWRYCSCKCILFHSRLAIALSSPKLVLHESRSVSAFCNIFRPDMIFTLKILNQQNPFQFEISNFQFQQNLFQFQILNFKFQQNPFQFQTWNVRLLHWQSQFTYWEAACKFFLALIWNT